MSRRRSNKSAPGAVPFLSQLLDQVSWAVVAATTVALPLVFVVAAKDTFRLPKTSFLIAAGLMLAALAVCAAIVGAPPVSGKHWPPSLQLGIIAVLTWSAITTLVSSNLILSIFSLLIAAASTMLFVAAYNTVQERSLAVVWVALMPALVNAVVAIAQRAKIWNPFTINATSGHEETIALLGNSNDLGMLLVGPVVAAGALGIVSTRHRLWSILATVTLLSGLLAAETIGAVAAAAAGLFTLLFAWRRKLAVTMAVLSVVLAAIFVRQSPVRWAIAERKLTAAAHGNPDPLLSGRIPAFLAAWRMFRQHPVFGVGLGCFPFHYFDEKIAVELEHPVLMDRHPENFGEAHNEHLQILAETGLPGYFIFAICLTVLGRISFGAKIGDQDARISFARRLAFPLAVAIFVLTLSSFPFRLAAPTENTLFLCAAVIAWGKNGRD